MADPVCSYCVFEKLLKNLVKQHTNDKTWKCKLNLTAYLFKKEKRNRNY